MNYSAINRGIRRALQLSAYSTLALSLQAFAQTDKGGEESEKDKNVVERIQVTGSNIRGVDMEGAQPLTILNEEDIAKTGANTISQLMRVVAQTRGGVGTFDTTQSGATSTSTPPGQAAASLRGIGPSATLTLVNGRRIAASSFAAGTENFVDINSIPASAVKRVEILATGASAIYGADAVAGVINYILKDNYEGFELNANYRNTTDNDDHGSVNLQALWGQNMAGGNLTVFADYFDRKPIRAVDFEQTRNPVLVSSYSYLPKRTPNIFFFSEVDSLEIGAPNCETDFVTTEFDEQICAYYANEDDYFETPLESLSGGLTFSREVGELFWKTDLLVSHTSSTSFSTPAPINQVDDVEGAWAPESALNVFSDNVRNALLDRMFIDPFDTVLGRELFGFRYDARFATPRTVDVDTTAFRLVSVLEGSWGTWDWESGVMYSRSESEQVASAGIYNRYKYSGAVFGELCSNGELASLDTNSGDLSCSSGSLLPQYNPFDVGNPDNDAILALTQERPTRDGSSEVLSADFRINGSLIEWGDDFIRMAAGVEFRKEEITDIPSLESQARAENDYLVDVFGFGSSLSAADRTQYGVFAEFHIPLTDTVQLNVAGRFDDYNDFGSTFNPKVGFTYRPFDALILRGAWSTAFRAPSLTQAGVELRTTTASFDCSANQIVANLYCEGQGSIRGNNVLELGNPLLRPEESESYSLGLAFSPSKNTHITLDYWKFDHQDIVDTNMTDVLARAVTDSSLRHCGVIPTGEEGISYLEDLCLVTDQNGLTIEEDGANLEQILAAWVEFEDPRFNELPLYRDHIIRLDNTGTQELEGVDFSFEHAFEFAAGDLEFALSGTHYLTYDRNRPGSDQIEPLAGMFRYPETVATAELFWSADNWYAGAYVFYTGSYQDETLRLRNRELDEIAALGELDASGNRWVSSWTTVTFSAGYFFENSDIRLTIDNVFDRDAPLAFGSARGFDAFNHDPYGTMYNLSFSYRFL